MASRKSNNGGVIFRTTITTRDGRELHARDYGLRAFRIVLRDPKRNGRKK